MSESVDIRIGERIRFHRQAQGRTQTVVAGMSGITEDYLSQIERGLKTPTIGLLHKLARVLRVRVSELLGESATEHDDVVHPIAGAVARALLTRPPREDPPLTVAEARERVDDAWLHWQSARLRYTEVGRLLPDLISDVENTRRSVSPEDRREAEGVAADLYALLRTFTRRIGRADLSVMVVDREIAAAEAADDPLRIAAGRWNLAHALLAQGDPEPVEEIARHAAESLSAEQGDTPEGVALRGALSLVEAVGATRLGDEWRARDILRERAWPAARATGEGNVLWTVFGPTNVGLHAVSIEMEAGEAGQALRLADEIDIDKVASVERRTTFALEVARCYELRRDDPGVLLHLTAAEQTGPEDLRYNALARDLVHGLLRRARPTFAPQVRALAQRVGLLGSS